MRQRSHSCAIKVNGRQLAVKHSRMFGRIGSSDLHFALIDGPMPVFWEVRKWGSDKKLQCGFNICPVFWFLFHVPMDALAARTREPVIIKKKKTLCIVSSLCFISTRESLWLILTGPKPRMVLLKREQREGGFSATQFDSKEVMRLLFSNCSTQLALRCSFAVSPACLLLATSLFKGLPLNTSEHTPSV